MSHKRILFLSILIVFFNPSAFASQRNPFLPIKEHPSKLRFPLQSVAITELKLVGIIDLPQEKIALIKTPNQRVYRVKRLDKIGSEKLQIINIASNKIILSRDIQRQQIKTIELTKNTIIPVKTGVQIKE